jgi:cytoskeletal protein CcmA (bactofilin family)
MLRKLAKGSHLGGSSGRPNVPLSVIGSDVRIVGDIITQGEMQIDGQLEGDITCQNLVIGEGAHITGEITADCVRIHGHLNGKVVANNVVIAKSANVIGDIIHESLEIEAGGHLEGHLIRKGSAQQLSAGSPPALAPPIEEAAQ